MIEDFALLDTIFTDLPKKISKDKIQEIFEILQSQERSDLTQEMKKLLQFKTSGKDGLIMAEGKETVFPIVNQSLPTELLKKILANLDIKSLCSVQQTCKCWKEIVDGFELGEKALSKFC